MTVKIISTCSASDTEYQLQREITEADLRGEQLKEIHYSTAPAIIAAESDIIGDDPPDYRAAVWHSVLVIFERAADIAATEEATL